jgi:hypothetical protein
VIHYCLLIADQLFRFCPTVDSDHFAGSTCELGRQTQVDDVGWLMMVMIHPETTTKFWANLMEAATDVAAWLMMLVSVSICRWMVV